MIRETFASRWVRTAVIGSNLVTAAWLPVAATDDDRSPPFNISIRANPQNTVRLADGTAECPQQCHSPINIGSSANTTGAGGSPAWRGQC